MYRPAGEIQAVFVLKDGAETSETVLSVPDEGTLKTGLSLGG